MPHLTVKAGEISKNKSNYQLCLTCGAINSEFDRCWNCDTYVYRLVRDVDLKGYEPEEEIQVRNLK